MKKNKKMSLKRAFAVNMRAVKLIAGRCVR